MFYSGLPQAWPGKLDAGGRPMIISFKAPPAEVLAGTHDARLRDWFRTAPTDQDIYWTYFHEPENDIQSGAFTAAQFRQAWQRIVRAGRRGGQPAAAGHADPHGLVGRPGLRARLARLLPGARATWT